MRNFILISLLTLAFVFSAKSNNLQVGSTSLSGQNTSNKTIDIKFDISWENSWRLDPDVPPGNYDAVWIFGKFFRGGGWHHIKLSANASDFSTGNGQTPAEIKPGSDGVGVFLQRSSWGSGTFDGKNVKLKWKYGDNGLSDIEVQSTDILIMGIEMVYVPQGSFWVGDGSGVGEFNDMETKPFHFVKLPGNEPYQISSEDSIVYKSSGEGNLWRYSTKTNYDGAQHGAYTYSSSLSSEEGTIPKEFPKGFNAFYCMKYELTQNQYAIFLNTLSPAQRDLRYNQTNLYQYRYNIKQINNTYGCDANNNGVLNESDDGLDVACNFCSGTDLFAYSDWAGLRPMTEFEYEKACRGVIYPSWNEFAWGNINIFWEQNSDVSNMNSSQEEFLSTVNTVLDKSIGYDEPFRVGICAKSSTSRTESGASYYGIMDMTGNLSEQCVYCSVSNNLSFYNMNGDGSLGEIQHNMTSLINVVCGLKQSSFHCGYRGWFGTPYAYYYPGVSERAKYIYIEDACDVGIRCVRSAE